MYRLQEKMDKIAIGILQIFYAYLGYKINLTYEYRDGFEFLIGIVVVAVIMNILDQLFVIIAYDLTGRVLHGGCPSSERKIFHWFIRVILCIIVYLISISPMCNILITPIVQDCTQMVIEWLNWKTK